MSTTIAEVQVAPGLDSDPMPTITVENIAIASDPLRFAVTQSEFAANLTLVNRAVSNRPSHPVLANIWLSADQETQRVTLRAFDLSLGIQTSFPADVQHGGAITLPAKLLTDIVTRLDDGNLVLEADLAVDCLVTLTALTNSYQVRGMQAEEFPDLPVVEDGNTIKLPTADLIAGLKGSLFAASSDETKQVLTGVHLAIVANAGLEFAATDGHRLSMVRTAADDENPQPTEDALSVTVPAKALQELVRLLERKFSEEFVTVHYDRSQIIFQWADQQLSSRLLEGQYPNYNQLIPRQFSHRATVERRLLISALERIAVIADQKNNVVKLNWDSDTQTIRMSVDAADVGSGQETIPVDYSKDAEANLQACFNVKYLLDGLKAIGSDEVDLNANTATSPAILKPVGDISLIYLMMPVQVRS